MDESLFKKKYFTSTINTVTVLLSINICNVYSYFLINNSYIA